MTQAHSWLKVCRTHSFRWCKRMLSEALKTQPVGASGWYYTFEDGSILFMNSSQMSILKGTGNDHTGRR